MQPREKHLEPGIIITVAFEDHGQDFLEWDICNNVVIDCRPFQAWMWVGGRIMESMEALNVGHFLSFQSKNMGAALRIRYPLEAVEIKPTAAENLPCFICGENVPASISLPVEINFKNHRAPISFTAHACPLCNEQL